MTRAPIVVLGVGNSMRRDDGAGPAVIEALARFDLGPHVELLACSGEPTGLVEAWTGRRLAVVVDAGRAGRSPGDRHRVDADHARWPGRSTGPSGHAVGLGHAVALARAIGRCPDRLILHGIEAAELGHGQGLSVPVGAAIGPLVERVLQDVAARGGPERPALGLNRGVR